jgi:carbon starvation protein
MNRKMYALCAAIPGVFMALITFWAGYEQVVNMYMPKGQYLLAFLACIAMVLMFIVFVNTFKRWYQLSKMKADKVDYYDDTVKEVVER